MPGRITPLAVGEIYHVYNRGSEKREIFLNPRDFKRFVQTFYYYQFINTKVRFSKFAKSDLNTFQPNSQDKLVEIICYCLMPNHFHLLLKQIKENGISIFMSKISNSYTKYFNTKNNRVGPLLQGAFKAVHIETDEQFLHASRYIHINPVVSGLAKNPSIYKWSSFRDYLTSNNLICIPEMILSYFSSPLEYRKFIEDQIDYGTSLEILKHQTIDIEDL